MARLTFRYKSRPPSVIDYQFSVDAPYSVGHQLTAEEAQALNQIRTENIQDRCRGAFARLERGVASGELLSDEALAAIQRHIDNYAEGYRFASKPTAKLGGMELEIQNIARERIEIEARGQGAELSEAEIEARIGLFVGLPEVREEARRRLEARASIAARGIEELLGGV